MATKKTESNPDRLTHSIEQAARALGVGRSLVFTLLKEGQLKSIRVGKRRLILTTELQAFLDRQQQKAG